MICPLCGLEAKAEEIIDSRDIVSLWSRLGMNVSYLFDTDKISKCQCDKCGLGFYNPPCPGDDQFYGNLAEWDWYYKHQGKSEYDLTAKLLVDGTSLVDVGCGIGEFSKYLPASVDFLGVELSSKSVGIAKTLGRNVQQLDIINAPEHLKNSFDVVTCFQVLEHVTDIHPFFSALVSLCKPEGLVVIAVPNNDGFMGAGVNIILNMPPHHVLLWNRQSLSYLAAKHGLSVVKFVEEDLADVHRNLAFSTKIKRSINKLLFRPQHVVDVSLFGKVINRLSSILARPLIKLHPKFVLTGHSSIIIIKKTVSV